MWLTARRQCVIGQGLTISWDPKTFQNLQASFFNYFTSLETQQYEWVLNLFVVQDISVLSMIEQENLIDIRNDMIHKNEFAEKELTAFWMALWHEFSQLAKRAIELLLPFGSSYLCELGFSALTEIKSKKTWKTADDRERNESLLIQQWAAFWAHLLQRKGSSISLIMKNLLNKHWFLVFCKVCRANFLPV